MNNTIVGKNHSRSITNSMKVEVEYLFSFAKRPGYLKGDASQIEILLEEVGKLLWSFYRSL